MSTSTSPEPYDYTEGASAIDIQDAIDSNRRARRDSQYEATGDGYIFDGPSPGVNPSSVSRMSLSEHGRRSSEGWRRPSQSRRQSEDEARSRSRNRRMSRDSRRDSRASLLSDEMHEDQFTDEEEDEQYRRWRRKSPSPAPRPTVFENIAQIFTRAAPQTESPPRSRRPSISSRRSSRPGLLRRTSSRRSDAGSDYAVDTEDEERWGYASEEEDDSDAESVRDVDRDSVDFRSIEEGSYSPSSGLALHVMTGDPIFGDEARIDMGELNLSEPPPPGPPSRQMIFLEDEDAHIRFVGYEVIRIRQVLWQLCCVLTFGILGLLGHWFPRLWLHWVTKEKAFKDMQHGFIVIEVGHSI
jgi:cation-transporting P-type ATPase 13A2